MKYKTLALAVLVAGSLSSVADACTSIAWNTDLGTMTTRTMDWVESTKPVLGNINKGEMRSIQGNGMGDEYQVKYDVVAVFAYGELVGDGVNSEGLQVNTLFYPSMVMEPVTKSSQITQFTFGEYLLTNYASVEEVVKALPDLDFGRLSLEGMPMEMNLHWSVTDKSGDRLVIEMDEDGLHTYRGEDAMVMTNDPSLQQHIDMRKEVESRWVDADRDTDYGSIGNGNAHSRYVHASYFMSKLTEPTSVHNGMMKLSTVPYRVPADAPYMDFGNGMMGYATEWTLTQSLETGDSVFEYNFEDNWNTVRFNVYDMMGKEFRIPLDKSFMVQL
ncbi:choloylglycine hydrolase [Photobacterium rosenbergii]|uniref:Choloylglycine hydrolase n=1 Tax=Photobacterium rosenbergii TaxID=294936 RepID=A0A2T3NHS5_9GAMM|nr:linear amide C-N hydrolase [Photobacterium rosenbergii]PSW14572.1 choloylglycine hydrolase [Photobacterium rosenbergii]